MRNLIKATLMAVDELNSRLEYANETPLNDASIDRVREWCHGDNRSKYLRKSPGLARRAPFDEMVEKMLSRMSSGETQSAALSAAIIDVTEERTASAEGPTVLCP